MVEFDNVFETKENKIQIMIKLNHNINTRKISGESFSAKKKKLSKKPLLWLYTRSRVVIKSRGPGIFPGY